MVVETYGNWWNEARDTFSRLATGLLLAHLNLLKSSLVFVLQWYIDDGVVAGP